MAQATALILDSTQADLPAAVTDVCLSRCSGLDAAVALGLLMTQAV